MQSIQSFLAWALPFAQDIVLGLVIFAAGWQFSKWSNKLVRRALEKAKVDVALARFLGTIAQYTVLVAAIIAALGTVGIETTSVIAVFASAGLAVGLALQGSLANFASGVMILFFKPFSIDDFVTIGGHMGTVTDIGLFATSLTTPDNQKVIIPNSTITSSSIINHTTLGKRRGEVEVGVAYGSDLEKVQEVLLAAARKPSVVLDEPEPTVAFVGLGASSLDFKVFTWCEAPDYLAMLHEVRSAVYEALNEAGIEIPFNQLVVHQG